MFFSTITSNSLLVLFLLISIKFHSQGLRAIDNKGSFKIVKNNRVFTKNDDPSYASSNPTPPSGAIEGDIWLDDSGFYRVPKIWDVYTDTDGTVKSKWKNLINNNELYTTPIHRVNSDISLTENHHTIVVTGNNEVTITLPAPNTCEGRMYRIKNISEEDAEIYGGMEYKDVYGYDKDKFPKEEITVIKSNGTSWIAVKYTL